MNFDQLPAPDATVFVPTVRTDMATPAQVSGVKKAIYQQLVNSGQLPTLRGFANIYYGILLTLADHGSSKRLSAHPDVALIVECYNTQNDYAIDNDGAVVAAADGTLQVAQKGPMRVVYQMAKLGDAVLAAGVKSVRRFARAQANVIFELIEARGFAEQTQWHIKSNMPRDLWQWAFDVADYVTVRTPDEREKVAIAASRSAIRATEEIVNYGTQTRFTSGQ
jgi:hypothetical protein